MAHVGMLLCVVTLTWLVEVTDEEKTLLPWDKAALAPLAHALAQRECFCLSLGINPL